MEIPMWLAVLILSGMGIVLMVFAKPICDWLDGMRDWLREGWRTLEKILIPIVRSFSVLCMVLAIVYLIGTTIERTKNNQQCVSGGYSKSTYMLGEYYCVDYRDGMLVITPLETVREGLEGGK